MHESFYFGSGQFLSYGLSSSIIVIEPGTALVDQHESNGCARDNLNFTRGFAEEEILDHEDCEAIIEDGM